MLDLHLSLAETEARTFLFRNHILGLTLSLIVLLALVLTLLSQRLVAKPVAGLLAHVRRLSRGQLDSRIATRNNFV